MTPPAHALWKAEFPRSNGYDPAWVLAHQMGPNALWLVEWLCEALPLEPGMRVLDLGCGKGLTSIFLAREMGVHVWATDLWVGADPNWQRIREAGAADRVCPIHAEAHALPFAEGFFDAVVSIDAYHYFGTDDLYLGYLARFVRTGGILGVVFPGLMQPIEGEIPPHLLTPQSNGKRFWEEECACFHTASWWRALWSQTSRVSVRLADTLPDGWRHWRDFERALEEAGTNPFPSDAEALDADQGRYLGFVRLVAERTEAAGLNLYDPDLLRQVLPPGGENRA